MSRPNSTVKQIWQGRAMQVAARYGDQAPMAAVCCNACRTCTTTNLLALATGMGLAALYAAGRFGKRLVRR
jgi:homoaconitase/3-isopropylmalate dehydratase large subunit